MGAKDLPNLHAPSSSKSQDNKKDQPVLRGHPNQALRLGFVQSNAIAVLSAGHSGQTGHPQSFQVVAQFIQYHAWDGPLFLFVTQGADDIHAGGLACR